jgi:Toastrack DUF4097
MRRETFPVSGPVAVVAHSPAGTVEVEAADVTEATIELEPLSNGSVEAVEQATVELRGGGKRPELVVEIHHGFRLGGRKGPKLSIIVGKGPSIGIRIRVPRGSSAQILTEAADVNSTGVLEEVEVKTASGDVRIDEVENDATVKSVSGDVALSRVGGRAAVNSVSGDATIGSVAGPASVHSVSGDIEIREGRSSLNVKTISGDVEIRSAEKGEVAMQSVSGDLTLGLRAGSKLWVDARSTSGKTVSELEVGDEPPANGGPLVEFRAKSISGDIRIVRA